MTINSAPAFPAGRIQRFFRTPKGLVLVILTIFIALAAPAEGWRRVAPGLIGAIVAAGLLDLLVLRIKADRWEFPSGAVLTALFIAMVLTPHQAWYVTAATSAFAVASKCLIRTRAANVFNPAALGLVFAFYVFHTAQNWWGAMPEITPLALIILFAAGVFIADRVNKMPLVLVFLGVYFLLFTATAFSGHPGQMAEIFRAPDLHAALFFAFFILTDPPTSPVKYGEQVVCGVLVAVVSYACFELIGAAYYLLAGALVGNVWEAWRRYSVSRQRLSPNREASVLS